MPDSTSTAKQSRKPARSSFEVPTLAKTRGPEPGTPLSDVLLAIGVVVGTHGLGGEIKMKLTTDDPDRLLALDQVQIGHPPKEHRIESVRFHKGMALVGLNGIDDIETAESLRGQVVRISGADVAPLEPDEYYLYQVVGLEGRLEDGTVIGSISDVIETGANMVFVVTSSETGKDELFPSIPEVVIDLQPEQGFVLLRRQRYWDVEN